MFGIMHCDTLQIYTRGDKGDEGLRKRVGLLGLGLLIGGATFAHGLSQGCSKAEILAINDDGENIDLICREVFLFFFFLN